MCFSCFETAWAGKNIRCPVKDDRDLEVFEVCGGAVIRWVDGLCGVYGSGRGRRVGRKIFLVFIGLHLRVQLFLSFGVWMKGRLLWNANA